MKKSVLYLGNFSPKTSFAALNRALGICKLFKESNYSSHIVVHDYDSDFLNDDYFSNNDITIHKFEFNKLLFYFSSRYCLELIKQIENLKIVVLYNFPHLPSVKIFKYCKKNNIKVIGDVTEWYDTSNANLLIKPIKFFDTEKRMRKLNFKLDGLITISNYLYSFYEIVRQKIKIYPLMDYAIRNDNNPKVLSKKDNVIRIGYAGVAGNKKDNICKVIDLLSCLGTNSIELHIIGTINKKTKNKIKKSNVKNVYYGHMSHEETVKILTKCDCQIIFRSHSRMNDAGFPTKFAESLALGIPTIVTDVSDLSLFSSDGVFVINGNLDDLNQYLISIMRKKPIISSDAFWCRSYSIDFKMFIKKIENYQKN